VKNIPEANRASWRFHIVKQGETLDEIALALHAHASEIVSYNEIKPTEPIEAGDELIVPVAAASAPPGQQRYTLRSKDTLVTVADRFGVTVEQLRAWNHIASGHVAAGRSLYVAEPIRLAPNVRSSRERHAHPAPATAPQHASAHVPAKNLHSSPNIATGVKKQPTH
jgi:membrane-bound lytic murein transglycosylase D